MSGDKPQEVGGGSVRQAEIFRDRPSSQTCSEGVGAEQGLELFSEGGRTRPARPSKTFTEAAHDIPVFAETDVLIVGGGPAGTAAAIAAARLGADVLLVERYNHLGGLATGGVLLWFARLTAWV